MRPVDTGSGEVWYDEGEMRFGVLCALAAITIPIAVPSGPVNKGPTIEFDGDATRQEQQPQVITGDRESPNRVAGSAAVEGTTSNHSQSTLGVAQGEPEFLVKLPCDSVNSSLSSPKHCAGTKNLGVKQVTSVAPRDDVANVMPRSTQSVPANDGFVVKSPATSNKDGIVGRGNAGDIYVLLFQSMEEASKYQPPATLFSVGHKVDCMLDDEPAPATNRRPFITHTYTYTNPNLGQQVRAVDLLCLTKEGAEALCAPKNCFFDRFHQDYKNAMKTALGNSKTDMNPEILRTFKPQTPMDAPTSAPASSSAAAAAAAADFERR
jgi:hypothetical protein